MHAGFAFALAAALGASDLRLDLSVRSEGRSTTYAPGDVRPTTLRSVEVWPQGVLVLEDGALRATARYGARYRDADLNDAIGPILTQQAELGLAGRVHRVLELTGAVLGERGWTDPLLDVWSPGVNPTAQPIAPTPFESWRARAGASWTLDRSSVAAIAANADETCGVGADARALLPCQRTETVEGSLTTRGSTRDLTRFTLGVYGSQLEGGMDAQWVSASAERREDLTRHLVGRATLGASVWQESAPGGTVRTGTGPLAEIGIAAAPTRSVTADLSARTAVAVYRVNGEIRQMASAVATFRWAIGETLALQGSGMRSDAWWGPTLRLTALDARLLWRMHPRVRFELGVLGRQQLEPATSPFVYREAAAFIAVAAEAPTIR